MSLDEQPDFGGYRFVEGKKKMVEPKIDNNRRCGYKTEQNRLEVIKI